MERTADCIRYSVSFDEKYDVAMVIERFVAERKSVDRAEVMDDKLKTYGLYENIPLSIKAEVFGFSIDGSSSNLKLYMQVMKKLGVRMRQEEMYEEIMKQQDVYNMQKERMWKHGRAR